jgi:predicted nucleic acid-binding Zn ribbon protein
VACVEDWEQFFKEKSRRRSRKDRRRRRLRQVQFAIAGFLIGLLIVGGIIGASAFE